MRLLPLRPGNSLAAPNAALSMGFSPLRVPSWLPSKLRGFWFVPRWVCPPSVLAFWSYKQTKPAQAMALRSLSPVFGRPRGGRQGDHGVFSG